jgi:biopolymer transport protein ExbD
MRRLQPAYASAVGEGRPIAELNMTPLIDVLLVLIVMFILLVPAVTNELPVDLPRGPTTDAPGVTHRLTVTRDGAVALDGVGLSDAALAGRLAALGEDAAVTLAAAPDARYERAVQVLAVVKRAGVTRLGFEGLKPV